MSNTGPHWLDELFAGNATGRVKIYLDGVEVTPTRGEINLIGAISAEDNDATDQTDVTVPGVENTLTSNVPPAIAVAGDPGVASTVARSDHTHAHGSGHAGGLHAPATSSTQGELPAADKRWIDLMRAAPGADLTDADETIVIAGGAHRKLPTVSAARNKTLGTAGAVVGDTITVEVTSADAFDVAFLNGGAGAGTLYTRTEPLRQVAVTAEFDGTNWKLVGADKVDLTYIAVGGEVGAHNGFMSSEMVNNLDDATTDLASATDESDPDTLFRRGAGGDGKLLGIEVGARLTDLAGYPTYSTLVPAANTCTSGTATLTTGKIAARWILSSTAVGGTLPEASTVIGESVIVDLDGLDHNATIYAASGDNIDSEGVCQIQGPNGAVEFYCESASRWLARPAPGFLSGRMQLFFEGDSITAGQGLIAGQTWPSQVAARVRGGVSYHRNDGNPGDTIDTMQTQFASHVTANFDPQVTNAFVFLGGTNNYIASESAATVLGKQQTILTTAKTAGFALRVALTIPPSTVITAGKETARLAGNALMLHPTTGLVAQGYCQIVVDINQIPEALDASNVTYYSDGTHPTKALNDLIAAFVTKKINAYLGFVEPAAVTLTSLHDATQDLQCIVELRADQKTLSGSDVATAIDVTGLGHTFLSADNLSAGGHKPAFVSDDGDGFACWDFDHTNSEALIYNGTLIEPRGPWTMLMYMKPTTSSNGRVWSQSNAAASHFVAFKVDNSGTPLATFENDYDSGSALDLGAMTISTAAWHKVLLSSDGKRCRIYVDDKLVAAIVTNANTITTVAHCIGAIWAVGTGIFTPRSFKMRHFALFSKELTWAETRDAWAFVVDVWT